MLLRTEDLALTDQRERASRGAEPTKGLVINRTEPQMSLIRDPVFRLVRRRHGYTISKDDSTHTPQTSSLLWCLLSTAIFLGAVNYTVLTVIIYLS